jgi:hypothetical protein
MSCAPHFPGRRIGVLGDDSPQVIRDMAAQVRTGRYQVPSSDVDFESMLSEADLPVLAVAVTGETPWPHPREYATSAPSWAAPG